MSSATTTSETRSLPAHEGSLVTGSLGSLGSLVTSTLNTKDIEALGNRWGEDSFGTFPCPWPGHEAPASFTSTDGVYMLACCSGHTRSLAEVWAARAYGRPVYHLSNIELATWWRRLAHDLGGLQPVEVDVPMLPPGAPPDLHRIRNGFALLLGLRRVDYPARPVAFSVRFAAAWCGVSLRVAGAGIRVLREEDVIHEVERAHGRIRLYEPGAETE